MADPRGRCVTPSRGVQRSCSVPRPRFVPPSSGGGGAFPAMADPRGRCVTPSRGVQRSCSVFPASHSSSTTTSSVHSLDNYVLLATVAVLIEDGMGKWQRIRCLLDSGCQIQAITATAAKRLKLTLLPGRLTLMGISGKLPVSNQVRTKVMAINGSYRFSSNFYVIPELSTQPIRSIKKDELKLPAGKLLADESFCNPGPIDAILGAGICFDSIGVGFQRLPNGLILQNSKFGWVIGGMLRTIMSTSPYEKSCHKATCIDDLKVSLERFWNVEELPSEVPDQTMLKNHELEDHFKRHMRIADDGRYIVRIPLRGELNQLGDSIEQAQRRLLSLERKLARHEPTYVEYRKFMREYLELGHMAVVPAGELHKVRYVIPHSCVIKPDSTTTKLRVVFDASAKSSSGISLNDLQAIGPVIQPDLLHIWLYFRTQTVVVTADIAKMYRQVWVAEPDTWMQCILWREKTSDSAQMYRLRTVTYGEAFSSYLACRALYEAGDEVRSLDPKIADAIQRSFYVDNLSLGAATADELRALSSGVERALMNRGMPLRKWASNDPTVINEVPEDHLDATVQIGDRQAIKMLGLAWCPTEDTFQLIIDDDFHLPVSSLTKRCLVARIAKLYDPVGILQPVIVTAKILMQDLWRDNLAWDECVPHHAVDKWNEFTAQLPILRQLHIPRMALPSEAENSILHGFCDASTKAYGCAIYARYVDGNGDRQSRLVCSKSRVAPLKQLTLPRLELQAALLLAELYVRIKDVFGTRIQQTKWWTDSQVVLAWIRSDNSKWDVFVKNRVGKIQTATDANDWHYVPTKLNPADIVSRGLPASKLVRNDTMRFWLNGPDFVVTDLCPQPNIDDVVILEEVAPLPQLLTATVGPECEDLVAQYKYHNSFIKTRRHFAWLNRAIHNFRLKSAMLRATTSCVEKRYGPLLLDELEEGLQLLLRVMQATSFPNETQQMHKLGYVVSKGPLQHLNPIVRNNLICVQGRLANAEMTDGARLPILVPKSHPFSRTIIRYLHEHNFHAGTELVMAEFRTRFWMRDLRRTVIGVLSRCVVCVRARPRQYEQQMGQLPAARVHVSPAFTHTGVDLCGPFDVIPHTKSKRRITVFVCLFVCFTTKAIHLEVVENLSTSAFISALLRFVSLRGRPDAIYSDNGRNFVGAAKELSSLRKAYNNRAFQDELVGLAAEKGIRFSFIPPRSPNFGGLWEANIKTTDSHPRQSMDHRSAHASALLDRSSILLYSRYHPGR
ncbi:uncharacterized protein LOC125768703 [Anopheles funestus]|uniref:uncharacterized protein LOC125768703 n=1 Tax=Anopheles funestus TaxID=62324 RepID=UPI0020C69C8D|nr:uncharacterized protein LOC125768703 [Anopheles funestus]